MARTEPEPIHLEGTTLEGGGQLLRVALGLSSLIKKPIHITNIRGKRSSGGGLKVQHLTSMLWLGRASNAQISGAGLKSKEITFRPHTLPSINPDLLAGHVSISQNTPGGITLVLQAVLPYILFSGAQAANSPSLDYVLQVLIPMLSLIGVPHISSTLHSRGWSQRRTRLGSTTFSITPLTSALPAFHLQDRGAINSKHATIIAPLGSEHGFRDNLDLMLEKRRAHFFGTQSPDITISVRAGKTTRIVPHMVRKVSDDLLPEIAHGGCVDEWMADQLVVYQALAHGSNRVHRGEAKSSLHVQTVMWVAERVAGTRFDA
ncbi:EPT/RTPC-like protein [Didymella exigua CBS 183.55]|uniref:EPT/RTPC-like protein n=1 Tax=Didymella exigua CBS 183.55 TaxID=1150837 RepID=A0A6A5S355_9PLEO|nr:EPT/RTPC-like protein [Didymella exigua CBS 183.55]KAF1931917.1 EPT/RTPC-like protein [Didymella exigua CBS 183.55]